MRYFRTVFLCMFLIFTTLLMFAAWQYQSVVVQMGGCRVPTSITNLIVTVVYFLSGVVSIVFGHKYFRYASAQPAAKKHEAAFKGLLAASAGIVILAVIPSALSSLAYPLPPEKVWPEKMRMTELSKEHPMCKPGMYPEVTTHGNCCCIGCCDTYECVPEKDIKP